MSPTSNENHLECFRLHEFKYSTFVHLLDKLLLLFFESSKCFDRSLHMDVHANKTVNPNISIF